MKEKTPIRLNSAAPLDDGGRKYNGVYILSIILFIIIGIITGEGIYISALAGVGMGWFIKTLILAYKGPDLRNLKFQLDYPISNEQLVPQLVMALTPLGMMVEVDTDGSPVIIYKRKIYDIILNEDQTFQIWWRKSIISSILTLEVEISKYRRLVVAMGIIAYHIQEISRKEFEQFGEKKQSSEEGNIEKINNDIVQKVDLEKSKNLQYRYCNNCGEKLLLSDKFCKKCGTMNTVEKKNKKWITVIIAVIAGAVVLFVILCIIGLSIDESRSDSVVDNEYNENIVDGLDFDSQLQGAYDDEMISIVLNGSPNMIPYITYEEAYEYFFTDPKWRYFEATDGSDVVEFSGGCLYGEDPVTVYVQFVIDEIQETFELCYANLNGISMEDSLILQLIYRPFSEYSENILEESLDPSVEQEFIKAYEAALYDEYYSE